jgi:hypothetical protein
MHDVTVPCRCWTSDGLISLHTTREYILSLSLVESAGHSRQRLYTLLPSDGSAHRHSLVRSSIRRPLSPRSSTGSLFLMFAFWCWGISFFLSFSVAKIGHRTIGRFFYSPLKSSADRRSEYLPVGYSLIQHQNSTVNSKGQKWFTYLL